jgi:hypothetical protein
MKSIMSLPAIAVVATLLVTGCNPNKNNSDSSTNAITDGTGGMLKTNLPANNTMPDAVTNLPATNAVPDLNKNLPASTNQ